MTTARPITTDVELAALEVPWNILAAGEPLRSWDWLASWWTNYGQPADRELHVVAVYDGDRLIGIAPWYLERTMAKGSTLRPLGDGETCTDHLSLITRPEDVERVTAAVADYLLNNDEWDRLELTAVDEADTAISLLVDELQDRDCLTSRQRAGNCWVIDLPNTWDEYMGQLSQSHRRQLKKCQKVAIESDRSRLHLVTNSDELDEAWSVLVDLHQRRRNSLGDAGCFASQAFFDFHCDVTERLLAAGKLRMSWIEFDDAPFTAEYHLAGPDTIYTYQSGMDIDRLQDSPGRLAYTLTLKRAIEEGFRHVDFMRGDESYKSHFRAVARPQVDYLVFPNRQLARLRGKIELAGRSLKQWVKQGVASVKH